ncbi:MAG: cytochrome P450 [Planctomycetaceae bacterium]|nr:cytochrome P450 [Planctomycetaceae bacterium]
MNDSKNRLPLEIPGPAVKGLFGGWRQMLRFAKDSIGLGNELFAEFGNLAALAKGGGTRLVSPRPVCPGTVLVCGPELTQEVATNHEVYHKFHLSGRLHPVGDDRESRAGLKLFGAGLFAVNEEEHRRHRKLMAPAFYNSRVAEYRDVMVKITQETLDRWQLGQTINIQHEMQDIAQGIASKALFGEDLSEQGDEMTSKVQEALLMISNPFVRLLPYNLPGLPYKKLLQLARESHERTEKIIARRRALGTDGNDVLSMLLKARDQEGGLSEEELNGHVSVLFAAGHETSANALTWTLFLLSQHPQVHADLCNEIQNQLDGRTPTNEDLEHMPLLERVIKESMRVMPPVPWNGRVCSRETELGGFHLPVGTEVLASIYHTHHMPEIYPEPARFDPSRWETITPTGYEYQPFSSGPRICIGAGFAMLEIKIVMSMLLSRFRVEFLPGQTIERVGTIVSAPQHGIQMKICPLDGEFHRGVGTVVGNVREMVDFSTETQETSSG